MPGDIRPVLEEQAARGRAATDASLILADYLAKRLATIDQEGVKALRSIEGLSPEKAKELIIKRAEVIELMTYLDVTATAGHAATEKLAHHSEKPQKRPLPT